LGIDLSVERPCDEGQVVSDAQAAVRATHLRFVAATVDEPDEGAVRAGVGGELRLRFLARRDDVHVTDEAICELLACIPGRLRWVRLAKLEEFDGVPGFPPLPAW
jgi:hypothetical protein